MNKENLQQLAEVYNNLLKIHTCGEETFLMANCMRALFNIINDEANQASSEIKDKEE